MDLEKFWNKVKEAKRIGIAGHLRPDGDCIGSCLGLANYIRDNFDSQVDVFAEEMPVKFEFLQGSSDVIMGYPDMEPYDLFIALDSGDLERIGDAAKYFNSAAYTYCFDHHPTNVGYAKDNMVCPNRAACSELLFYIMDEEKISKATAEALYLGIVHDTGVFKFTNVTKDTMIAAGVLIEKGANPTFTIDKTFYEKSYVQNQILGRCLMESVMLMNGKVIFSAVTTEVQKLYGITNSDMDGIIDNLRITKGVEVAILLKEAKKREWKVSLRSCEFVDVSKISLLFNGGGHVRASGCVMHGSVYDVINSLTREIEKQMPVEL